MLQQTQHSNKRLVRGRNKSQRWCSVYNTAAQVDESFDCIRMLIKPSTTVCLYPDQEDSHVSRHLREDGLWEPHIVRLFQNLLYQNPDLGVVDVGAHIGQYSLLAAAMGRRVVAVEPHRPNLHRLHKAIQVNGVQKQVRRLAWSNFVSFSVGFSGMPESSCIGLMKYMYTGLQQMVALAKLLPVYLSNCCVLCAHMCLKLSYYTDLIKKILQILSVLLFCIPKYLYCYENFP